MDSELRDLAVTFEDTEYSHLVNVAITCGDGTVRDLWLTRRQALHLAEKTRQHYAGQ